MSSYDEIGEAIARNLEGHGFDVHRFDPDQPTFSVYDGDGNLVFQRKVGPLPP